MQMVAAFADGLTVQVGLLSSKMALQKWLNGSICCLGCGLGWAERSTSSIIFARWCQCAFMRIHLHQPVNMIELFVCGGDTHYVNFFDHLLGTVCKTVRPLLLDCCPVCLFCLSRALVYCDQMVGWIIAQLFLSTYYYGRPA